MSVLLIVASAVIAFVQQGMCDKVFVFQGDNQLSNESRAVLYLTPDLLSSRAALEPGVNNSVSHANIVSDTDTISDVSVCLWLKIFYFRETTNYAFSYATSDMDNNELNFGLKYNQVILAIGGKYIYGKKGPIYIPDTWYHMCVVANSEKRTGTFYINGQEDDVNKLSPRKILLNGSLVLGQETDQVNGGFQSRQSFSGVITGFNLYSRSLSAEEVVQLSKCSSRMEEGDLVSWKTAQWEVFGQVDVQDLQEEEYCHADNFNFVVFSKQMTRPESLDLCQRLKSSVALPRSEKENRILYDAAEPFVEQCHPHNHATSFFWLGATQVTEGNWIDDQKVPLNYTNIQKTSKRECLGFSIPRYREEWYTLSCSNTYKFCAACQEQRPMLLKMRGLCESSLHASFFRMVDQYGEMPFFRSFIQYNIAYDKNGTWALFDVWSGTILATFFTYDEEIPFGEREWRTTTNFGICQKKSNSSHKLSLSACYDWEYSCGDGTCINLTQRCDMRVDCPDNTDETGCEKLLKPTDYLVSLPPPGSKLKGPLNVNVTISIHGFSEIDIRNMKLVVDFTTVMRWFDSRVRFKNLRDLADLNYVESDSVWTPRVDLLNADFPKIYKTNSILTIVRMSDPEIDDPSRISRDEVYEGAKNPLMSTQKFNAPFSCAMDMKNFPFDTQHCQLLIRFTSAKNEFLHWDKMVAKYLGEVMLAEYKVGEITVERKLDNGYSLMVIGITFYRRYQYYLTSAYVPTVMLMLISYASLFCKRDNCDLRVMMALTTLLVLYALYQQISNDLPRTSYTKAIDVWCFFAITFIFTQVIWHVMVNVEVKNPLCFNCLCYRSRVSEFELKEKSQIASKLNVESLNNSENLLNPEPLQLPTDERDGRREARCHSLIFARIFYMALFFTFCSIYWVVVLTSK